MPERRTVRQTSFSAAEWFDTRAISALCSLEQRQVAREIVSAYGQCGLFVRPSAGAAQVPTEHRIHHVLTLDRCAKGLAGDLCCRDDALPIASETMGLIYVQHALESAEDPDAMIGELARVLVPEGIALFIVFNPYRPFRMRWWSRGLHAISANRLSTMVSDQGLEVRGVRSIGACWRAMSAAAPDAPVSLLAGSYLLLARKRVHGLTPLRAAGQRVALNAGVGAG